jgi:hypothetical protein
VVIEVSCGKFGLIELLFWGKFQFVGSFWGYIGIIQRNLKSLRVKFNKDKVVRKSIAFWGDIGGENGVRSGVLLNCTKTVEKKQRKGQKMKIEMLRCIKAR